MSSTLYFILKCGQFCAGKLENHHEPPLLAAMQLLEQGGTERRWWGCGRTPGVAAPGLALLTTALLRWAAGWAWVASLVVLGPVLGNGVRVLGGRRRRFVHARWTDGRRIESDGSDLHRARWGAEMGRFPDLGPGYGLGALTRP